MNSEPLLGEGHEQADAQTNLNMPLHRIDRSSVKRLDPQVLLDPLKEQLHLPALLVDAGNRLAGMSKLREAIREILVKRSQLIREIFNVLRQHVKFWNAIRLALGSSRDYGTNNTLQPLPLVASSTPSRHFSRGNVCVMIGSILSLPAASMFSIWVQVSNILRP